MILAFKEWLTSSNEFQAGGLRVGMGVVSGTGVCVCVFQSMGKIFCVEFQKYIEGCIFYTQMEI